MAQGKRSDVPSTDVQLDAFRHSPAYLARVWRDAADASLRDFPGNLKRWGHYDAQAREYEFSIGGMVNSDGGISQV